MSLTEVMIGSQLQPTLSLLCDWPTETCIVPSVETAHGYNDLIYSVTCVNIFFSSVLPCLSLYFGLFISHYPALPLFFLLPLSPAYQFIFLVFPVLCVIARSLWRFDLSYGTDKTAGRVCVCVSICIHTHLCLVSPGLGVVL